MTDNSALQSRTIAFLRFPLIVGVVLIHTYFKEVVIDGKDLMEGGNFPIYSNIAYYLSQVLASIAVPLFFFISGYLFFYRTKDFPLGTYKQKMRKRARTILLPYILWNGIYLLVYFFGESLAEGLFSGRNKPVSDYSFADFLWAFWDRSMINPANNTMTESHPVDYPLWFIRDLFVVMLFSPLLHLLIQRLKHYFIIMLGVLWFFGYWFHITGLSSAASFFFSAGAYFSINGRLFTNDFRRIFPHSIIIYLVLSLSDLCLRSYEWDIIYTQSRDNCRHRRNHIACGMVHSARQIARHAIPFCKQFLYLCIPRPAACFRLQAFIQSPAARQRYVRAVFIFLMHSADYFLRPFALLVAEKIFPAHYSHTHRR